jgi:hypothetical protein
MHETEESKNLKVTQLNNVAMWVKNNLGNILQYVKIH